MSIDIKVPALPESVSDATIAKWHKQQGDNVKRDENLVDIETDKVVLEVVAPADGTLGEIIKNDGTTVQADEVIAKFESGTKEVEANAEEKTNTKDEESTPDAAEKTKSPEVDKDKDQGAKQEQEKKEENVETKAQESAAKVTGPAARRSLYEKGEETTQSNTKPDSATNTNTKTSSSSSSSSSSNSSSNSNSNSNTNHRHEERLPMTRLRKRIAERLLQAQQNAAILTTFNEIDMSNVMSLRSSNQKIFEEKHGVKLGFMSLFIRATVEALKKFPAVNAAIDGDDILYHNYFDIGIAVSAERGLVVPVIRDADLQSLANLEKTIRDFGSRAQAGSITLEEMTGGTFTISNGGVFGSLMSTPIINPPQSGILGMHKIEQRPVVINNEIVIRPMMYVALSYDHRMIDGKDSVQFLAHIKALLEEPAKIILDL